MTYIIAVYFLDRSLDSQQAEQVEEQGYKTQKLLLVFGGMDTRGEIFNDCCVLLVDSS